MTAAGENIKENQVHFYTLNVGQGDSHVIHFPNQKAAAVIDPGHGTLINELLHEELKIKHLPLILITHFDLDHMNGLNEVIRGCTDRPEETRIKPGYVFFNDSGFIKANKVKRINDILEEFDLLSKKHELKHEYCTADNSSAGLFVDILKELGIAGRIIYPERMQLLEPYKKNDANLFSVLLYLVFAHRKILYTGDLPYAGWQAVDPALDLTSDVFKVPHHGGKISGNPGRDTCKILERVNPHFALISVGEHKGYKHPRPEVVSAIINHESAPHLFCTRMTEQCHNGKDVNAQIENFYENELHNYKKELSTLKIGSRNGTLCAGTIRVIFDRDKGDVTTFPSIFAHTKMLKSIFNNNKLPCLA